MGSGESLGLALSRIRPERHSRAQGGACLDIDLATDWSVYIINRLAAQQILDMGATRFALSPEDGFSNARTLWTEFGAKAVLIVYQDTPQFLAESCAYANLIGGCPGKANCRFESMEMVSSHGERVTALDYHCRTIVLNQGHILSVAAACRSWRKRGAILLRADFLYRPYDPADGARPLASSACGSSGPRRARAANFDRDAAESIVCGLEPIGRHDGRARLLPSLWTWSFPHSLHALGGASPSRNTAFPDRFGAHVTPRNVHSACRTNEECWRLPFTPVSERLPADIPGPAALHGQADRADR